VSSRAEVQKPALEGDLSVSFWISLLKAHGLLLQRVRGAFPDGLTMPQFDVLAQLERRGDGMTPGELTRELLVTKGNVTGIVERLVRRGFVERRRVPHDGRARRLVLTPEGRRMVLRAIPEHRREIAGLLAGLPPADLRRLRDLLRGLVVRLEGS
jgi:DNA-binding MarR family transcriptional regulator